eukprot:gene17387-30191_t
MNEGPQQTDDGLEWMYQMASDSNPWSGWNTAMLLWIGGAVRRAREAAAAAV